ncbi:hypothetical protein M406DRAFT_324836, partial [Cryphonectria parasitica EP155]
MQAACEKRSEEIQSIRVAKLEHTASKHMQAACEKHSEEIQSIRVAKLEQTASKHSIEQAVCKQHARSIQKRFRAF